MKILISDKMANEAIELLKEAGHDVTFDEMDGETLLNKISGYDALMVRGRTKAVTEIVKAGANGNLLEEQVLVLIMWISKLQQKIKYLW